MLLDDDVQAGVLVDRRGTFRGLVKVEQVADGSCATPRARRRIASGSRVAGRGRGRRHDRLGLDGRPRSTTSLRDTVQHLYIDADRGRDRVRRLVRAGRRARAPAARVRADHRYGRDPVHDPEPRAVRRARARSRPDPGHGRDPPRPVHAADPRSATSWPGSTRSKPTSWKSADGMGYRSAGACGGSSCPSRPADRGRAAVAAVSTIGLVTITGAIGDAFGGLGYFIFEGCAPDCFPTEICSARCRRCSSRSPWTSRSWRSSGARPPVRAPAGRRPGPGSARGPRPRQRGPARRGPAGEAAA